jgi:hypothetical protein
MSGLKVLDAVNPLKDDKGINATAQVGKNNTAIQNKGLANIDSDTQSQTTNNVNAQKVDQVTSYKDAPWLILAFAIAAGFALPNPFSYFSHRKQISDQKEVIHGLQTELRTIYRGYADSNAEARQNRTTSGQV